MVTGRIDCGWRARDECQLVRSNHATTPTTESTVYERTGRKRQSPLAGEQQSSPRPACQSPSRTSSTSTRATHATGSSFFTQTASLRTCFGCLRFRLEQRRRGEFELLARLREQAVPASRPVDFGRTADGSYCYMVVTYIPGQAADEGPADTDRPGAARHWRRGRVGN